MKRVPALFIMLAAVIIASCGKSKFETVPTIEIKSISPGTVSETGTVITVRARVTDKQGDVKDSVLIVPKKYDLDDNQTSVDTFRYSINTLDFPDTRDIELAVQFSYGSYGPGLEYVEIASDEEKFAVGLIVIDVEGNRSEYKESGRITLKKPS